MACRRGRHKEGEAQGWCVGHCPVEGVEGIADIKGDGGPVGMADEGGFDVVVTVSVLEGSPQLSCWGRGAWKELGHDFLESRVLDEASVLTDHW